MFLFTFFSVTFSLLFTGKFYWSVLKVIDSILLSPFYYWAQLASFVCVCFFHLASFYISYTFQFYNSICYRFYFFAYICCFFSTCLKKMCVYWNIFMTAVLKFLISTSVLLSASVDYLFSFRLWFFLVLSMMGDFIFYFYWILDVLAIMLWDVGSYEVEILYLSRRSHCSGSPCESWTLEVAVVLFYLMTQRLPIIFAAAFWGGGVGCLVSLDVAKRESPALGNREAFWVRCLWQDPCLCLAFQGTGSPRSRRTKGLPGLDCFLWSDSTLLLLF